MSNYSVRLFLSAIVLALASVPALAQTNPNEAQGLMPYDTWHGGDLDSVSVTNGGLTLNIPLVSFPQRGGLDLSFFIRYSSKQWLLKGGSPKTSPRWVPAPNTGAQVVSSVDWWMQKSIPSSAVTSPDGATHQLAGHNPTILQPTLPLRSLDATGLLYYDATTLIMPDGTRYSYPNITDTNNTGYGSQAFPYAYSQGVQASSVSDANGNQININTAGSVGWVDTMNRVIPGSLSTASKNLVVPGVPTTDLSQCPAGTTSAMVWNVPGVAGVNNGVRTYWFCYTNTPVTSPPADVGVTYSGTMSLLTAIVLPNSTKWTFAYDGYADLKVLGFPTGGSISYDYIVGPGTCDTGTTQSMWVSHRTVDANDGTGPHTWSYSYSGQITTTPGPNGTVISTYSGTAKTTSPPTAVSPSGDDTVHTVTNPITNTPCSLYVTQTQYYQGLQSSGTLLKTTQTQYSGNLAQGSDLTDTGGVAINVVPVQMTTSIGGRAKKVVKHYDPDPNDPNNPAMTNGDGNPVIIGSLLQIDEYDFSGALQRSLVHRYQWEENPPYKTYNFVSLVSRNTALDGSGAKISETTFGYDDVSLIKDAQVTVQHVNPGSMRGNLNYVSRWLDTANATVTDTIKVYDTGMKYQAIDRLGNTTTYTYSPDSYGTYLTRTDMPDTQMPDAGAPAVHHSISGTYDFNTGLLTSFTDENGQVYGYEYRDPMLRMTKATHPDLGETDFTYPDPNTLERRRKIAGTTFDDYFAYFDGVGRTYKTKQLDGSGNLVAQVDTTYDALGRVASVSNPHGATAGATDGLVQYQYDALGRTTRTTKQDGSASTAIYNDNANASLSLDCTTATDEAGKVRRMCTDFAERLAEVDEPGGSTAGTASSGSLTINGSLQSTTTGGTGATAATGSVTIGGTEHSITNTTPGTPAKIIITIGGSDSTNSNCLTRCTFSKDAGSVNINVNAGGSIFAPAAVSYNGASTPTTIAQALAASVPSNSAFNTSGVTTNADGTASFTLTTTAASTGANSSNAAVSFTSGCVNSDTMACAGPGWTATFSGPALSPTTVSPSNFSGGKDPVSTTIYDSGTVAVTVNSHGDQVAFGQNDNAGTIAANLASKINGDTGSFVTATASGATVSLKSKNTGTATNYTLSSSYSYDSADFSSQGPSFTPSNSGTALTGGKDGTAGTTVTDSGTVRLTVGSFSVQACYGPNGACTSVPSCPTGDSTGAQLACLLTQGLNTVGSPVTATASGSTITMSYNTPGAAGNVSVLLSDTSNNPNVFPGGSFGSPGTTLSGGVDGQPATLATPYVTTYQYDARNDLLCVHQKGSDTTPDKACNDATVPAAWRPRVFAYDSFSRLLSSSNPESGRISYQYDNLSRLTSKTDARNITATYSYDALSRATGITYSDGTPSVSYRYDYSSYQGQTFENPIGRRVAAISASGASSFTSYDVMGRVKKTVQCVPGVASCQSFNAGYDALGDLRTLVYPSGLNLTYGYDTAARLTSVADSSGFTYANNPTYLPTGMIQQLSTPNINYHTDYNNRLQPTEIWAKTNAATPAVLFDKTYQYDPSPGAHQNNGDVLSVTNVKDNTRTQTFTYDALNRLATAGDQTHWANSYTYDAWGNLTQKNQISGRPAGESMSVTADTQNRLRAQNANGTQVYSYDASGNLLSDGTGGYIYDAESRIIYSATGGVMTAYTYDADGRRVKKASAPETDLAQGKAATQSSTFVLSPYPTGDAWRAVDGNTDGNYSDASVSSTNVDTNAWWQVDLGAVQPIDTVKVWNRTDCCPERLSNFYVMVSNQPFSSTDLTATISQAGVSSYFIAGQPGVTTPIAVNRTGRYVRVQLAGANYLSLAEVQVMGVASGTNSNSATTYWYGPGGGAYSESDSAGSFTDYVFYAGQMLARKVGTDIKYYITDHLHSTAVFADKSGAVLDDNDFYPWGGAVAGVGFTTSDNHYKFTGQERDAETGLDYFGARYYNSATGRFMSADWSSTPVPVPYANLHDPQTLNLYSYARNTPVTRIDEGGHWSWNNWASDDATNFQPGDDPKADAAPEMDAPDEADTDGPEVIDDEQPSDDQTDPEQTDSVEPSTENPTEPPAGESSGSSKANEEATDESSTESNDEPECSAKLLYRPVEEWRAKLVKATHSFWDVVDADGKESLISAGPIPPEGKNQKLNTFKTDMKDDKGNVNKDAQAEKDKSKVAFDSGKSSAVCSAVANMKAAQASWPQGQIAYKPGGPNSNSAARYFGEKAGFNANAPPHSYGWGASIPFPK